ncbi:MAG TPA: hypothetical protein VN541_18675 [Tepidisphaeraceae bacterium]|nr:hypothetical protein [Tepidisphaeraceae bacterium]
MPAVSKAQQRVMAIAEHDPRALYRKDRSLLRLSHQQLHDFAATPSRALPERKSGSLRRVAQRLKSH